MMALISIYYIEKYLCQLECLAKRIIVMNLKEPCLQLGGWIT